MFEISAYIFFSTTALVVVVAGSYFFALKRGFKSLDALIMLLSMAVAAFIGARLFNILIHFDWFLDNPSQIFSLSFAGFSLYGGLIFAILAGLVVGQLRKIPLFKFADTTIPFVGIGIAIFRIGCFITGCCFGKETDLPWGVTFEKLSPAHLSQINESVLGSLAVSPVHPTQLYELIAALIGVLIVVIILKKKKPAGTAFLAFGIWFSAFRLFNNFLRVLPYSDTVNNYFYPIFYITIIFICGYLLVKKRK